jgi:hypothetical protein
MKEIKIWMAGAGTGLIAAVTFLIANIILSLDGTLTLVEFGVNMLMPTVTGIVAYKIFHQNLILLLIVAYLTSIIPVGTALFGAPNMGIEVIVTLVIMGTIGGLFWITPFVIWKIIFNRLKRKRP